MRWLEGTTQSASTVKQQVEQLSTFVSNNEKHQNSYASVVAGTDMRILRESYCSVKRGLARLPTCMRGAASGKLCIIKTTERPSRVLYPVQHAFCQCKTGNQTEDLKIGTPSVDFREACQHGASHVLFWTDDKLGMPILGKHISIISSFSSTTVTIEVKISAGCET